MNEIEGIRWQLGHYRSGLHMQMDRLYNALEELQRTTLMLMDPDTPAAEDIDQWLEDQGFTVDEDGFFQSLPQLRAFRQGRAPEDAISISWGQHLRSNKTARRHLYFHRNIGPHLKHIHDRLGNDLGWIYYQDAVNVSLQYPYIDQRTAIPSDFDWRTYHTFVSVNPANNPERHIRWTPPTIDYAGEGLILSVSIPVWRHDNFVGLWSIDLPLRFLYRDFLSSKGLPEQMQFIVNQEGLLVLDDKLKATVDQPHGKVVQHSIAELGGQWREVDITQLTAQGDGQLEITDDAGREWVFCYSHITDVKWTLFCGLQKQAMEEAAAQRLRLAFQQIASGNYSHRIESSPTNALPALVDEFNKMSRRLGKAEEHRKKIENRLFQAQKMEAVGRLASSWPSPAASPSPPRCWT
jgi:HAMP domain-containing protein